MEPGNLGQHLRALRVRHDMSLRELAKAAEIAPASLSAVENGASSPTLATLHKLLKALRTDFISFFQDAAASTDSPVFRAADAHRVEDAHRVYHMLFPKRDNLRFELLSETIGPAEGESEWETHDCDVGGVLIEGGPLQLEIQGNGAWPVHVGDAFYIPAQHKHRATNKGEQPARLITVFSPPGY